MTRTEARKIWNALSKTQRVALLNALRNQHGTVDTGKSSLRLSDGRFSRHEYTISYKTLGACARAGVLAYRSRNYGMCHTGRTYKSRKALHISVWGELTDKGRAVCEALGK
jgi:hypothetical protein